MQSLILLSVLFILIIGIMVNPALTLSGAILLFPLEQLLQATLSFFLTHNAYVNILIAGAILVAFIKRTIKGEINISNIPRVYYYIFSLFLYAFISSLWVKDPSISEAVLMERLPYVLVFILILPLTINDSDDLADAYKNVLLLGSLLMIVTLFFVEWDVRRIVLDTGRSVKETGNPLAIARFAGELAIIAIFFGIKQKSTFIKISSVVVTILGVLVIIKSGTRGQLLALFLVAFLFSIKINSIKNLLLIGVLCVFFGFIVSYFLELYWGEGGRWSSDRMEGAFEGRVNNIRILFDLWISSPLTILFGLGNSASYHPSILGLYPHNMTVEILCEEGLIGFFIFLIILIRTFKSYSLDNKNIHEIRTLFALFIYAFIVSFKQGSMLGNVTFFMYSILVNKVLNENKK